MTHRLISCAAACLFTASVVPTVGWSKERSGDQWWSNWRGPANGTACVPEAPDPKLELSWVFDMEDLNGDGKRNDRLGRNALMTTVRADPDGVYVRKTSASPSAFKLDIETGRLVWMARPSFHKLLDRYGNDRRRFSIHTAPRSYGPGGAVGDRCGTTGCYKSSPYTVLRLRDGARWRTGSTFSSDRSPFGHRMLMGNWLWRARRWKWEGHDSCAGEFRWWTGTTYESRFELNYMPDFAWDGERCVALVYTGPKDKGFVGVPRGFGQAQYVVLRTDGQIKPGPPIKGLMMRGADNVLRVALKGDHLYAIEWLDDGKARLIRRNITGGFAPAGVIKFEQPGVEMFPYCVSDKGVFVQRKDRVTAYSLDLKTIAWQQKTPPRTPLSGRGGAMSFAGGGAFNTDSFLQSIACSRGHIYHTTDDRLQVRRASDGKLVDEHVFAHLPAVENSMRSKRTGKLTTIRIPQKPGDILLTPNTVVVATCPRTGWLSAFRTVGAPRVSVVADITEGEAPLTVRFALCNDIAGAGPSPTSCAWTFDDGAAARGLNATHKFTKPGEYHVMARVIDGEGRRSTASRIVVVHQKSPPGIVRVAANNDRERITVTFDEPVSRTDAQNVANYSVSGGVEVKSALLRADWRTVILTTTALNTKSKHALSVSRVRDLAQVPNSVAAGTGTEFEYRKSFVLVDWGASAKENRYGLAGWSEPITSQGSAVYSGLGPAGIMGWEDNFRNGLFGVRGSSSLPIDAGVGLVATWFNGGPTPKYLKPLASLTADKNPKGKGVFATIKPPPGPSTTGWYAMERALLPGHGTVTTSLIMLTKEAGQCRTAMVNGNHSVWPGEEVVMDKIEWVGRYETLPQIPVSAIRATALDGSVPFNAVFDGSGSFSQQGKIARYEWDFGDGRKADGPQARHAFGKAGEYMVELKVSNDKGLWSKAWVRINVRHANPSNPIPGDDSLVAKANQPLTIKPEMLLNNDTDGDGDKLTLGPIVRENLPRLGGLWTDEDGTLTYKPYKNHTGVDDFTYTVSDGKGGRAVGRVKVKIVN